MKEGARRLVRRWQNRVIARLRGSICYAGRVLRDQKTGSDFGRNQPLQTCDSMLRYTCAADVSYTGDMQRLASKAAATLLAAAWFLGGCAANTRAVHTDGPPPDFSLDLTILVGNAATEEDPSRPRHLRQSRYIVFPDGRLHYGADPQRGPEWLPPAVRTLDWRSMKQLWAVAEEISLADPVRGELPFNFKLVTAERGEVVYLLAVTGQNQRWAVTRANTQDAPDPAMTSLIEHLADLAWVEQFGEILRPLPQRYDFGPDPYERYR